MQIEEIVVCIRLADGEPLATVQQVRQAAGVPENFTFQGPAQQSGNAPDDRILWFRFVKQ